MVSVLRFRGRFIVAPKKGGGGPALSRGRVPASPRHLAPELVLALIRRRFCARAGMKAETTTYTFGPYKIDRSEVFYSTPLSYAMVNLRPLLPGHVLVCPGREVKRFVDLSADETSDLWLTAKEVGDHLERYHEASSLTFAILAQVHPFHWSLRMDLRLDREFHMCTFTFSQGKGEILEKNDEIYEAIDEKEKELKEKLDLDKERKDRMSEEMAREADEYRALFS
ncbi:bifunctional bis(5'-adenosyl)-triphosphatase/adenylylsulfatase FHIT-like isoform X1 [Phoenix dactylifera]|uniref:Bifunctional bis(5'-adenosyl)-triphosphatase/adenylylsulfatase FHIT-like isoform X1 n=1 Tax=Phoenix dactylifera TaxID=42345 RepID=A0A8B9A2H6_PHODC|nr:bifunctional bis(5'-adenosyl)-triphosphatase/adenylylsulfatase FHIT-like isoform X1 [Phoenix dactylifera]